jgi:AcrR family transcriptional regulator
LSDVKSTILAEATVLFARTGFDRVTVRDIARASGITMPTIYHHFGGKSQLYQAVVESAFRTWTERVMAAVADAPKSIEDLLYRYFLTNLQQITEGAPPSRIVDRVLLDAAASDAEAEIAGRIAAPLNEIIEHAIEPIVPKAERSDIIYFMISLAYGAGKLLPIRHHLPEWKGRADELTALSSKLAAIGKQFLLVDAEKSSVQARAQSGDIPAIIESLTDENTRLKLLLADAMLRIDDQTRRSNLR